MPRGKKGTAQTPEERRLAKREIQRRWRQRNPGYQQQWAKNYYSPETLRSRYKMYQRRRHLWQKYKIREADYAVLVEAQNGKCAICGQPPKTYLLAVDHNHTTGKVRALLCHGCNAMLRVLERPDFFLRSAAYLTAHDGTDFKALLDLPVFAKYIQTHTKSA